MTRKAPRIEVVCVGSELLNGKLNTHLPYFARHLSRAGLTLARETTLDDGRREIARGLRDALGRADAVIVAGGLGPTFDDLTREGAADATGHALVYKPALFKAIAAKFKEYNVAMSEENSRQAWILRGATVLDNRFGSAPGQILSWRGKLLVLMPGPFTEMAPMFEGAVLPALRKAFGRRGAQRTLEFQFVGVPESAVDHRLRAHMDEFPGLHYTILAGPGAVLFLASGADRRATRGAFDKLRAIVRRELGEHLVSDKGEPLVRGLQRRMLARKATLAAAESCSGGGLADQVTEVPGCSGYFLGGVVAYDNSVKRRLLGVKASTLERFGAVSAQTAREMALGVRKRLGATYGVGITGIAGPGGGTKDKPVGLTYVAVAGPEGPVEVVRRRLHGDRSDVKDRSARVALHLLWRRVK